ncbi:MAG: hypothetical protein B0A82_15215 [Alkalinema sp. CACIAM 70d]|nr:MAG: hypothetical protein B0A82_15215 [Alkalinema sp. CACIAM 70d]
MIKNFLNFQARIKSLFGLLQSPATIIKDLSDLQAPPVEPLRDTWRWDQDAGDWFINLPFDFAGKSVATINRWVVENLSVSLETFSGFLRPWKVEIKTRPLEGQGHSTTMSLPTTMSLQWNPRQPYEEFIQTVLDRIQTASDPIGNLRIDLDMCTYVRTADSPESPLQAWVRGFAKLNFQRGYSSKGGGGLMLYFYCTLFCRLSLVGDLNDELYELNQPILAQALQTWKQRLGGEIDVEAGRAGLYRYGFRP